MREFCTSGSVGGEGGNILTYPATEIAVQRSPGGTVMCYRLVAAPTPTLLPPETSDAKEPAVHPWTRGRFRSGAGHDGEAAHQSSRPRIRAPAAQHRGS